MGYDKPDLGFCVHVGSPPSPVSYYQQVGRAGRGIDHAPVVLLPSDADAGVWDYFATATIPDPDRMRRLLDALPRRERAARPASPALEAETGLAPRPGRADAQAARRRRGGRAGRGRLGRDRRAVGVRRGALRRRGRGPPPRGRHHARLHPRRALPDAAAAGVPRRPDRRSRAGGARCAWARCPTASLERPVGRGGPRGGRRCCAARRTSSSRARCGRAARSARAAGSPPAAGRAGPGAGVRRRAGVARASSRAVFARDAAGARRAGATGASTC